MTTPTDVLADPWRAPVFVGAGVVAASVVGFGALVDGVNEHGDLSAYDPGITSSVASLRRPGWTVVAELASLVGSEVSIGLLSLVALGWLWFVRRDRVQALLFGVAMGAAAVLTVGVKFLVGRHRPPAAFVVGPVDNGFAFPSGHTLFSTVFLGMAVMLLVWPAVGRRGRILSLIVAVLGSLAVGASRVYLGYHWTTDVLGSWVLGVAVLTLALAASTMLGRVALPAFVAGETRRTTTTPGITERADDASSPR
ncbi:hypothetical protein JNB_07879 [Janibacter sp. HTCC2649]|uniref:phosphatase PAP2 family protein n=1 Tax=Janibacter sp. HTCC2649 TaxID=313589 RepID=UPI000067089C|nr:phosphatase PAP2 family protein [Janibacter sp. HTCC2649]EAQ00073.1 hypothetical protein JNB_07879 [Janibacter sp. HTCC2649]